MKNNDWKDQPLLTEPRCYIEFQQQCAPDLSPEYKYKEDQIITDFKQYIDDTYQQHYKTQGNLDCFDIWLTLDYPLSTFRNTALKYLWRLGKKGTKEDAKKDVLKTMHYCLLLYFILSNE